MKQEIFIIKTQIIRMVKKSKNAEIREFQKHNPQLLTSSYQETDNKAKVERMVGISETDIRIHLKLFKGSSTTRNLDK
jgi:hypothetical protein